MASLGWIKLHRKVLDWEWYQDTNTKVLLLHLILKANYEDKNWHGITIKRGQLVTGLHTLRKELNISTQSLRTSLARLKSTSEITHEPTNKYSIITINNYDIYNENNIEPNNQDNKQPNKQVTINQQASNNQSTTTKEYKNIRNKENKEIKKNKIYRFIKPTIDAIKKYCAERKNNIDADEFFNHYQSNGWNVGRNPMKDWKAAIITWEKRNYKGVKQSMLKRTLPTPEEQAEMDRFAALSPEERRREEDRSLIKYAIEQTKKERGME